MTPETLAFEKLKEMPPVLLVHGLQDTVVPAMASQQAQMVIKSLGGEAKYIQRPYLAHSIDNEGIKAATEFCQKIFKKV
jgi:predicted esterase